MDKLKFKFSPDFKGEVSFKAPRKGDAGYDLQAAIDTYVMPGEQALIPTGIQVEIPEGWVGKVFDRSSMVKKRLYVHGGVIDSSYRGPIQVLLENKGDETYNLECGVRIAQLIILPYFSGEVEEVEELSSTERGEGGFGSTGI